MSILDEITKEKQRLSEALARVDAQRDKLTNQLTELGATERVLARYSKGTQTRKTRSGKTPIWMRRIPSPSAPSMSPAAMKTIGPLISERSMRLATAL
jgi:hypothetical protein